MHPAAAGASADGYPSPNIWTSICSRPIDLFRVLCKCQWPASRIHLLWESWWSGFRCACSFSYLAPFLPILSTYRWYYFRGALPVHPPNPIGSLYCLGYLIINLLLLIERVKPGKVIDVSLKAGSNLTCLSLKYPYSEINQPWLGDYKWWSGILI